MFKFKVFHTPQPRRFNHKPIYWDPEKEARDERMERVERELGQNNGNKPYKTGIKRGSFRQYRWEEVPETQDMRTQRHQSNIRLVLIIIALFIIAAILYFSSMDFLTL